jgi:integrase
MAIRIAKNQKEVPKGKVRFQFDTYYLGKRHRKNVTCYKSDVKKIYREWEKQIINGLDGDFTFFEKLDEYLKYSKSMKSEKTYQHEKTMIEQVVKQYFKKDFLLRNFRRSHADDFILWRRNFVVTRNNNTKEHGSISNATLNRTIAVMSYFFNWAIKKEYYHGNNPFYMAKLPENNQREVKLSLEQIRELLAKAHELDERLYQLIIFALLTGMRRGEIFSLTWDEVDLENSRIVLSRTKTKSKKARVIPVVKTLKEILIFMKSNSPEDQLVISDISKDTLKRKWNKLRENLPFGMLEDGTKLRFHDLRHLYAQTLLDLGTELEDIQFLLGHQPYQTTQKRYAMFARPDLHEKASKIDELFKLH